jgi:hypothetical protein
MAKKDAVTIDGSTGTAIHLPKKCTVRLHTIADIKQEIAVVYRQARSGTIDTADAGRFVWILKELSAIIKMHDFEERLKALEALQAKGYELSTDKT